MRVETERMYLYPLRDEEMRLVIEKESDPEMKQAYMEMLEGSLSNYGSYGMFIDRMWAAGNRNYD